MQQLPNHFIDLFPVLSWSPSYLEARSTGEVYLVTLSYMKTSMAPITYWWIVGNTGGTSQQPSLGLGFKFGIPMKGD